MLIYFQKMKRYNYYYDAIKFVPASDPEAQCFDKQIEILKEIPYKGKVYTCTMMRGKSIMAKWGYKNGSGLGKGKKGRLNLVNVQGQTTRVGFGYKKSLGYQHGSGLGKGRPNFIYVPGFGYKSKKLLGYKNGSGLGKGRLNFISVCQRCISNIVCQRCISKM